MFIIHNCYIIAVPAPKTRFVRLLRAIYYLWQFVIFNGLCTIHDDSSFTYSARSSEHDGSVPSQCQERKYTLMLSSAMSPVYPPPRVPMNASWNKENK